MDLEDWYHLDYFKGLNPDKTKSMLDGFTNYLELLNKYDIKTTFFVLSELADIAKDQIIYADKCGHEIACHGKSHTRPLEMDTKTFEVEIIEAKEILSNLIGKEIIGYRAPCYSLDNERYEIVKKAGFRYSSSRLDIPGHPLYGDLDLSGYDQPLKTVYQKGDFFEFTLSTKKFLRKNIAVSGGGWIRLLPWSIFMKPLIKSYLKDAEVYTLYIHPFELSDIHMPKVEGASFLTDIRSHKGLGKVEHRVEQLIEVLKQDHFEFLGFKEMIDRINYRG
jgi:polysaccharide deacetylase family protein (PEP-CTERM system associated)